MVTFSARVVELVEIFKQIPIVICVTFHLTKFFYFFFPFLFSLSLIICSHAPHHRPVLSANGGNGYQGIVIVAPSTTACTVGSYL